MRRYSLSILALLALPIFCLAQTGVPPFGSFTKGQFDLVNNLNANVVFSIPIMSSPGRKLDLGFSAVYNSQVWVPQWNGAGALAWTPVGGWLLNGPTGQILNQVTTTGGSCGRLGSGYTQTTILNGYQYIDALGTVHPFNISVREDYSSCTDTTTYSGTYSGHASDNSGYYALISNPANSTIPTITTKSGTIISTSLMSITDTNGNLLSAQYVTPPPGTTELVWTDTVGRAALKIISGGTSVQYQYLAPSGNYQTVTLNRSALNVKTNFGCSNIMEFSQAQSLPTSLVFPDGQTYQFSYEPTPGYSGYYTGRVQRVTLPGGGYYEYHYPGSNDGTSCSDGSALSMDEVVSDGTNSATWNYRRIAGGTTTITVPQLATTANANDIVFSFNGAQATQQKIYKESPGVNVLRTINTTWATNGTPATQVTILEDGTTQSEVDTTYDSNGLLDSFSEYDWGSSAHGALLRTTTNTYQTSTNYTSLNILNLLTSKQVKNGSGTVVAQTSYNYDESTVTSTSGTPQHVAAPSYRGNLTSIDYPAGSLISHFSYYDTGMMNTSTDVNGAVTTFNYGSGSCGNSYPTGVTEPLSMSRSMTWNCTGGVQLTATDENSQTVKTTYNDTYFWRPTAVTDQLNNPTTFYYQPSPQYCCPAEVASNLTFNNGNSEVTDIRYQDGLGRTFVDQHYNPATGSLDSTSYTFDLTGRSYSASLPCSIGWAQSCPTSTPKTTQTYDALNRPLVTTDGGVPPGTITNTYSQNDVLITVGPAPSGENAKSRELEYDALGRLTSVCEVTGASGNGACGQRVAHNGFLTKYTYDALNNLTGVTQNAQATSGQQTRSFIYDAMSRLTSETNPESGTTTYSYDVIPSGCWAAGTAQAGDLTKKVDNAGNSTCYEYDTFHRLASFEGVITGCTRFSYDKSSNGLTGVPSGASINNAMGRLVEAETDNCGNWPPIPITDEWFSYTPRGETSDVYASTPHSGGYYHSALTYWANGAPNVLTGPAGYYASWNVDGEGRPYQVPNLVTNTVYNTAGLPTAVTYASGDSDSFSYDLNTNRITQYKFTVGSSPQSLVGNLTWNANGTLQTQNITDPFNGANTQNCSYSYEDLSRLANANCGSAAAQTFTYDPFGNINKSGSPYSFQPSYSSSTNRMTAIGSLTPTYDGVGDVTNDSLHTYTWDAYGRPATIDSVTMTYDAFGKMVEQNRSGSYTQFTYAPNGQKMQIMNGQASTKSIVNLPGGGQAVYNATSLLYYGHTDHLGSTRFASTPSRTTYFDGAYAPFGEPYAQSGNADLSFTGQRQDTVAGLYDFPAREYSYQGRWPSPDPAGQAAVDPSHPQSWNRYAYVINAPTILADPSGLCPPTVQNHDGGTRDQPSGFGLSAAEEGEPEPQSPINLGGCWGGTPGGGGGGWGGGWGGGGAASLDGGYNGDDSGFGVGSPLGYGGGIAAPVFLPVVILSGYYLHGTLTVNGVPFLSPDTTWTDQTISKDAWNIPVYSSGFDVYAYTGAPTTRGSGNTSGGTQFYYPPMTIGQFGKALEGAAIHWYCGGSAANRTGRSVRFGAAIGAARGAYRGFVSGELFGGEVTTGGSGLLGAGIGAVIGGIQGSIGGLATGSSAAEVCREAGQYGQQ